VKIKYADFKQVTRSRSSAGIIITASELTELCNSILSGEFPTRKGVRLLGITLSSLEHRTGNDEERQFALDL